MTKRVNRNFRTNLSRFLTGLFVGGVLLFQGTGYITSNLAAAENQNVNVATDGTTTPALISDGYNGLLGPSGEAAFSLSNGGTLSIGEGFTAVLGNLDAASEEPYPTAASEMTLESGSTLQIDGSFLVYGLANNTAGDSILTVKDGANITVSNSGNIENGTISGSNQYFGTIILEKGGTMTLGTADVDRTLYSGIGTTANMGTIQINNKTWDTTGTTGDAYKSNFYDYYDYNLDDTTDTNYGTLTATGKVVVGAANIFGTVTANEFQIYSGDTTTPTSTFKAGSSVTVTELLTVGTSVVPEDESIGSDLVISTDKAAAGGVRVHRNLSDALGGSLTVNTSSSLSITGLSNESGENYKFDAAGAQGTGESNLYDVYLDLNLVNAGTITFGSSATSLDSGIAFTGDATGATVTTPVTGLANTGTITAYGSLALLGMDVDANQTATVNNSGTITVADTLSAGYSSAAGLALANTGTISAGDFTLNDANISIANSGEGAFRTQVLTLSEGSIEGSFVALEDTDEEGNTVAGYTSLSGDQTVNLTNNVSFGTETDAATAQFEICDTAKMSGDYTAAFTNTDVVNSSNLTDAAVDVKEMTFGSGASYSYGKKIDAAMTFNSGSTLWVYPEDETLTLGTDDNLTVADGATIFVKIADSGNVPQIVLSGTGTATLAEGSVIKVNNLAELASGDYNTTLIKTDVTAGNTFEASLPEISSVFYSLTDNRAAATDEYILSLSVKGFEDLAETPNQRSVGRNLDEIRVNADNYSDEFKGMLDEIIDFTDVESVNAALNALSGVNKANSLMIAVTNPWANPFDRMDQATHRKYTPRGCSENVCRGQSGEIIYEDAGYVGEYAADGEVEYGYGSAAPIRSLLNPRGDMAPNSTWATFHHTSFNARTDENSSEYGISRTGVTLGYDMIDCDQTVAGLSFDYSQPFLYGADHRINTSNFNLGFYGRREFWNGMNLSVYLGGGLQDYTSKRTVNVGTLHEYHKGSFNGESLAGAIRLARDYDLGNWTILRPVVQFDSQQVWQEAFDENGGATALSYDKADLNRTFVRAGFETETNTQFFRFTGRALYAGLIGGDEAPNVTASFADVNAANSMFISGVDLGTSFLDLGVGALGYLDCEYRWMIAGNYDFAAGDKSNAHTGSVSLSYFF